MEMRAQGWAKTKGYTMTNIKDRSFPFWHYRQQTVYWKNSREMHRALRSFRGPFKAVLLELLERPMSRHEIREILQRLEMSDSHGRRTEKGQLHLEQNLLKAKHLGVLEERKGRYFLTPGGKEAAKHMEESIAAFMEWLLSAETASLLSILIHVLLSGLKLTFGFMSNSAGLIADGIDNSVGTLSNLSISLKRGIKYSTGTGLPGVNGLSLVLIPATFFILHLNLYLFCCFYLV